MKTDKLIRALAADTVIDRRPTVLLTGAVVGAVGVSVLLLWLALGFRGDLMVALGAPSTAMRFVLSGALALLAARLLVLLAKPEGAGKARLWPLLVVVAASFGTVLWAGLTTPPEAWPMAIMGKTAASCLIAIPLLAIVPVALILLALRRGATTAPTRAGWVAGLCGGGIAAMAYTLHCTEESPLFYVTWSGIAIVAVSLISGLLGARLLRW